LLFHASRYILDHVRRYDGDGSFLAGPTERTRTLLDIVNRLCVEESKKVSANWKGRILLHGDHTGNRRFSRHGR
jgi:pyruvate-formate lyase